MLPEHPPIAQRQGIETAIITGHEYAISPADRRKPDRPAREKLPLESPVRGIQRHHGIVSSTAHDDRVTDKDRLVSEIVRDPY
jgi:hypothetical protein